MKTVDPFHGDNQPINPCSQGRPLVSARANVKQHGLVRSPSYRIDVLFSDCEPMGQLCCPYNQGNMAYVGRLKQG